MTKITNPASPGSPTQVIAQVPVRSPISGKEWTATPLNTPAVVGPWPSSDSGISVRDLSGDQSAVDHLNGRG